MPADPASHPPAIRDEDYSQLACLLAHRALAFARVLCPLASQPVAFDERLHLLVGELIRMARDNLAALGEARDYADASTRQAASAPSRRAVEWEGAVRLLGYTRRRLEDELQAHQQAKTRPWVAQADRENARRQTQEDQKEP